MHWRDIVVDGKSYRWHLGGDGVVVQDAEGVRIASISPARLKGLNESEWERGHWKRTNDGMLTPADVERLIRGALTPEAALPAIPPGRPGPAILDRQRAFLDLVGQAASAEAHDIVVRIGRDGADVGMTVGDTLRSMASLDVMEARLLVQAAHALADGKGRVSGHPAELKLPEGLDGLRLKETSSGPKGIRFTASLSYAALRATAEPDSAVDGQSLGLNPAPSA